MDYMENAPLGAYVAYLNRCFKQNIKEVCNRRGINSTYSHIIMHLAHNKDGYTLTEIANLCHLSKPSTSLTIKQMESLGYIEKVSDNVDSRKSVIKLTTKGKLVDKEIIKSFEEVDAKMVENLDEEELLKFRNTIKKLLNNLSNNKEEA